MKTPTAEEICEALATKPNTLDVYCLPLDDAISACESHTQAHTEGLRGRVKELEVKNNLLERYLQEKIDYLESITRTEYGDGSLNAFKNIKEHGRQSDESRTKRQD